MNKHPTLHCIAIALLALAIAPLPAAATTDTENWRLRVFTGWVDSSATEVAEQDVEGNLEGAAGFGLGLEYRLSRYLGLEIGLSSSRPDLELRTGFPVIAIFPVPPPLIDGTDSLSITPVTVGLNIHLLPGKRTDVYVAPLAVYSHFGDLSYTTSGFVIDEGDLILRAPGTLRLDAKDDFGFGGRLGVDVALKRGGGPWSLAGVATYVDSTLEVSGEELPGRQARIDLDSWSLNMGFGYRF